MEHYLQLHWIHRIMSMLMILKEIIQIYILIKRIMDLIIIIIPDKNV